ncbi:MAG TPA: bifunctional diguanylate cyclase/phosphodiesterase [Micromonosporaceae bacterium]|nr:bifunctional diguanylate cyclase/phosphodiesterase [Micromonosporaceae bacterium]
MTTTTGLVAAATVCAAVGGPSATSLLLRARRGGRLAGLMLTAGVLAGAAGVVAAAVIGDRSLAGGSGIDGAGARSGGAEDWPIVATAAVGAGYVIGIALLVAGVLVLPGAAATAGARVRRVLDGVILALSGFYVSWTLLIEPMHRSYLQGPVPMLLKVDCLVVAVPAMIGLAAVGIALVTTVRATRPRGGMLVVGASLLLTALAGAALVAAVFFRSGAAAPLAAGYAAGWLGLAGAARYSPRVMAAPAELAWERPGMTVLPMLAMVAATAIRPLYAGHIDGISVGAGALMALAVAGQQALVRHDIRRDAVRLARSEAHFRVMAHTDALTGLGNRRALLASLESETDRQHRCVLLAIDLDGFKNVNDIRGHDAGDAVLIEVAARLRANLRPGDLAARLGGDEFAVLMRAARGEAGPACERLLGVLARPYEVAGGAVFLSASIGVAACEPGHDLPAVLRAADLALRDAKQQGKNRVQEYDQAYDRRVRRRTAVADALRGARRNGELRLVYQPVVALPEGHVVGVEALLRWDHPQLGQVAPDEFIPIAEESDLIDELGAFALSEACRQLALWIRDGHCIWVSVNVSVRELQCERYVGRVTEALRAYRVPPGRIVLEVTEHAVARDLDGLVERLNELRASGVRVALDDFGSGYSSLGQLSTLPVDILKIDRSLLTPPSTDAPLVDVVVALGNRLSLDVVAEGITDERQRRLLEQARCRYGQGELFGAAMPAEQVETLFGGPPVIPAQYSGPVDVSHEMRQS